MISTRKERPALRNAADLHCEGIACARAPARANYYKFIFALRTITDIESFSNTICEQYSVLSQCIVNRNAKQCVVSFHNRYRARWIRS